VNNVMNYVVNVMEVTMTNVILVVKSGIMFMEQIILVLKMEVVLKLNTNMMMTIVIMMTGKKFIIVITNV